MRARRLDARLVPKMLARYGDVIRVGLARYLRPREPNPPERARLAEFLGRPRARRSARDVGWLRRRMDGRGSTEYARQVAHGLAGAAHEEGARLYAALPDSPDRRFIQALPTSVLERR